MAAYLKNAVLLAQFKEFHKSKHVRGGKNSARHKDAKDALALSFYLMANKMVKAFAFKHVEPDDQVAAATCQLMAKVDKFNMKKKPSNPFAWASSVILNELRSMWGKETREITMRYKHLWENQWENKEFLGLDMADIWHPFEPHAKD